MNSELPRHFIRNIVDEDIASGRHREIRTRFPPEPSGYLHIGHAKSICLNFGLAKEYQGQCNLRFDDTNPIKEEVEFAESIKTDIKWLGFDWGDGLYHSSDYFARYFAWANDLISKGLAYVCDLTAEEIREYRGTLTEPGRNSPYRNRSIEENLDLFARMARGEFDEGKCVLRAKIDMSSGNISLRDPAIYRIRKVSHHMTGDRWCIYPMYDFAHCLGDAIEGITHSLCTLEFEANRPLYNWFIENLDTPSQPRQIEFAKLRLNYTIVGKRHLRYLVENNHVQGWDDPRMPTISGMRRRGYPPEAIRDFCETIGVAKKDSIIDFSVLEECVRNRLNETAPRAFCVVDPLRVTITNYPEGQTEELSARVHPTHDDWGRRTFPFSAQIIIDRDDFRLDPPKKYFRLAPGKRVRLRYGYVIECDEVIQDASGKVTELKCRYLPETLGGKPTADGKKVKGIIHWLSEPHSVPAEVRVYDRLFNHPSPKGDDYLQHLNEDSLHRMMQCRVEPSIRDWNVGHPLQFERLGYFWPDPVDCKQGSLIFNRTVTLKDTWAKVQEKTP